MTLVERIADYLRQRGVESALIGGGVVRCSQGAEAVDVIVVKHTWQAQILQRRVSVMVEGRSLPVVDTADLVLLKLYAGGPQDLLDIRLLLAAGGETLGREIEERLADLPPSLRAIFNDCRRLEPLG
ncbi:MAG: hypothetical protein HYR72_24945 [Deltaproteobacteria bacterium]|nr:hypothetical protein [Deltaproteobacteria bacterium]MBI3388541.1 hypothetical protein [Deltaproteobacteria bacterium]